MIKFIRGLPGSGKSTYAAKHYPDHRLIEADQFFVRNGVYQFDRAFLRDAHLWAQDQMLKSIAQRQPVVVANTFVRAWELRKYVDRLSLTSRFTVLTLRTQFTSVHEVPEEIMEAMRQAWEPWPGEHIIEKMGLRPLL